MLISTNSRVVPGSSLRNLRTGVSLSVMGAMLALAAPTQALAQTTTSSGLEEIVVEARRIEENLQRTPISVTAMSGDLLKALNVTRVQELASFAPNLIVSDAPSNGMGTIVYMRGIGVISVQASSDPPINIYIDGVVQGRSTGNAFDLPDIDRVEVLRGPQGTLFGRNTTGGAIAIYTKRPTENFGGSAEFAYGRDNEINASFVVNTGELGDSGVRTKLTFGRHTRDGWITTPGRSADSAAGYHSATSASFAVAADPSDRLAIDNRLFFNKLNTRTAYQVIAASANAVDYFSRSPELGGPEFVFSNDPLDLFYPDPRLPYDPQALSWGDTLTLSYDVNENLMLKSITGYSSLEQKQTGQLGGSAVLGVNSSTGAAEPGGFVTTENQNETDQFTQELQAIGDLNEFNYTLGLYYFFEDIDENLVTNVPLIAAGGVAGKVNLDRTYALKNKSYAAYANFGYVPNAFDGKLDISAGVRYSYDKKSIARQSIINGGTPVSDTASDKWDNVGWSTSASYQWTPEIMTFVRGSSSFRSGAYVFSAPNSPAVNPETAIAVEGGFKAEVFDRRLRLNGTGYKTWYDDIQINQRDAQAAVSRVVNAGKATFTGFDLEAQAILGNGFEINASLGHVDPKYQEYIFIDASGNPDNIAADARFPFVSKWTYNIGAQYKSEPTDVGIWTARLDYAFQSTRYFQPVDALAPNNSTQPSGPSKNLRARLTLSEIPLATDTLSNVQVQFYGDNLTNNRYRVSVVDFGTYATASFNRPWSAGVRLSADF